MLVLSRKKNETIYIGSSTDEIVITVCRCGDSVCRIGIDAPDGFLILRGELVEHAPVADESSSEEPESSEVGGRATA